MSAAEASPPADPWSMPRPRRAGAAPRRAQGTVGASWRLLRSEMRLILGRRRNRAGILVLAALPVLLSIALRASEPSSEGDGPDLISAATSNGVFVALTALTVEMALFLPLAVAVLSGDTIAGEANIGTLRYLLTVPVGRTRLLVVKYLSLVVGALIGVVGGVAGTGLVVGGALLGLGPTTLLSGNQISLAEALGRVALAALYVTAGLAGLAPSGCSSRPSPSSRSRRWSRPRSSRARCGSSTGSRSWTGWRRGCSCTDGRRSSTCSAIRSSGT